MIRVLHIIGSLNRAGAQAFIMNVYRSIDRTKIQFDFVVNIKSENGFDDEIKKLGGKIFLVSPKEKALLNNFKNIKRIVKDNKYKIVHRHTNTSTVFLDLLAAKLGGAKTLIAHSHNTNAAKLNKLHYFCRPLLNAVATNSFACSHEAGLWLFGNTKFTILKNGIEIQKFIYKESTRNQIRNKLELKNNFILGHVGRFHPAKNHMFLLDIFKQIKSKLPDSKLLLVGDGELRNDIENKIKSLDLSDSVILAGVVTNINDYFQAMDVFIMPSLYEGLPVTLVEAQAAGLKCFVADNVSKEVNVENLITNLNINDKTEHWVENIYLLKNGYERKNMSFELKRSAFDIEDTAKVLEEFYS
ncbi:glycosyltransferase family 1 protein [Salipaludibacillus daqingensis]|uniref:glycosyltransferase family 1 protein n=1 Tax=Salipaludibacillus daqingensis TaxID=3041001 RepID=UPI002473C0D6|nr:glycosyltransferase family 1 protein [Salipaludibacillus daqingensis]